MEDAVVKLEGAVVKMEEDTVVKMEGAASVEFYAKADDGAAASGTEITAIDAIVVMFARGS